MRKNVFLTSLQLFWVFFKIGLFTFGGGLAMISLVAREVVENKKWITEKEMGDVVIIAESTPGAIAVNTATYVGYKTGGVLGSLFATIGVVLPSLIVISIVYTFFDLFQENRWVAAAFKGVRAAVIVLLFGAAVSLYKPMEKNPVTIVAAAIVFLVAMFLNVPSIWLILAGGALGTAYFVVKAIRAKKALKKAANAAGQQALPPDGNERESSPPEPGEGPSAGGGEEEV